jgi:PhoPQ-activated pathogenicity-related protein
MILSIGYNKYLLNGVDNEIENHSFGKSIINSIVGKGEYVSQGYTARYTLIPDQLTTGNLSSIGFTKEAAKSYMDYVSGKKKLDYIAPKFEKTAEKVGTLPESTEKQTATKSQLQVEMENLELTDAVVEALYKESSKRMDVETFKAAAQGMIANLRATMSNEQILEKIKCL